MIDKFDAPAAPDEEGRRRREHERYQSSPALVARDRCGEVHALARPEAQDHHAVVVVFAPDQLRTAAHERRALPALPPDPLVERVATGPEPTELELCRSRSRRRRASPASRSPRRAAPATSRPLPRIPCGTGDRPPRAPAPPPPRARPRHLRPSQPRASRRARGPSPRRRSPRTPRTSALRISDSRSGDAAAVANRRISSTRAQLARKRWSSSSIRPLLYVDRPRSSR